MKQPFIGDKTLNRMNHLSRWQGFPTIKSESVAQHSFWVTYWTSVFMAELLSQNPNASNRSSLTADAVQLAVFHDVDEVITGDVTHPVKYNQLNGPTLRQCLKEYAEEAVKEKWATPIDDLYAYTANKYIVSKDRTLEALRTVVKVADYVSMFNYALHETQLGNQSMGGEMLFGIRNLIRAAVKIAMQALKEYNREYQVGGFAFDCFYLILEQVDAITAKISVASEEE